MGETEAAIRDLDLPTGYYAERDEAGDYLLDHGTTPRTGKADWCIGTSIAKGFLRRRGVQAEDKDLLPSRVSTRGDRTKSDRDKEEAR